MPMRAPLLAALLLLTSVTTLSGDAPERPYVPGEIIVSFSERAPAGERARLLLDLGGTVVRHIGLIDADLVELSSLTVETALARCGESDAVVFAEPNYLLALASVPSDSLFPSQWSLHNTGVGGGLVGADICALDAWDITTGSRDILVAVLDTGVDLDHPDLIDNLFVNEAETPPNGEDDDGNGFIDDARGWDFRNGDADPSDDHGHGTHCAGVVGAVGDNATGTAGVAWEVSILPVKLLDQSGIGCNADAIDCIEYAILMDADIMSASWSGGPYSLALEQAIWEASLAGVLFVAAAGNRGQDNDAYPVYPSCYEPPNIISVAASDERDALADELDWASNYGATTVDIVAPGTRIPGPTLGGGYGLMSGTSSAVPHVAGVLALMLADSPDAGAYELAWRLLTAAEPVLGLQGAVASGGRLNAHAAIVGPDTVQPAPVTDLMLEEVGSTRADIAWTAVGDDGMDGIASRYDVRYDTLEIDATTFKDAHQVSEPPVPDPPGSLQSFRVSGLSPGTTWYFALTSIDEYGNASEISNVAEGVTLGAPGLAVSPDSLEATVLSGASTDVSLRLWSIGEGVLDWTATVDPPVSWFAFEPDEGSIASGESSRVDITFSTGGIPAGTHETAFVIVSNDQEQPVRPVSVHLDVVGVPDIETGPDPVDFGELYVSSTSVESVFVWNSGTGTLDVSSVDVEGGPFATLTGVFSLQPGASRFVEVSFSPETEGSHTGELLIDSNDPDTPLVEIPLTGSAVPPPVAAVSPESVAVAYMSGELVAVELLLENQGGSPLSWSVDREVSLGDTARGGRGHGDLSGVVVARDRYHGEHPSGLWSVIIGDLTDRGASVCEIDEPLTPSVLESVDVLWITDNSGTWSSQEIAALGEWVQAGGGLLLEGDEPASTVSYNSILREMGSGLVYSSADGEPGTTISIVPHAVTCGVDSVYLRANGASIPETNPPSRTVVADNAGVAAGAVSIPGRGRVVAFSDEVLHDGHVNRAENRSLANQTFDWLALGVDWLTLQPTGGTVETGGSVAVEVSVGRDGMLGGLYRTDLRMLTGDPDTPELHIGVTATVTGFPSIALSDTHLDFGEVFVSATVLETLTVTNAGTDSLLVSSVEVRGDGFHAPQASFALWAGASRSIEVGFAPASEGTRTGTLSVWSNDADQPEAVVHLSGDALLPPDIQVGPSSLETEILSDLRDTLELVVGNVGASGLVWTASCGPPPSDGGRPTSPTWLSIRPASGEILPGAADSIEVEFDAIDLEGGVYEAVVVLVSNDPDEGQVAVPVVMAVTATPDIAVAETAIDFGDVVVGYELERRLEVLNEGTSRLHVADIATTDSSFSALPSSFFLDAGSARDVEVTFAPRGGGALEGALTILSDDPDEGSLTVDLAGTGVLLPDVSVSPVGFEVLLEDGESDGFALSIENAGWAPFAWDLDISSGPGQTGSQDLEGLVIMWDRSHGQPGIGCVGDIVQELRDRGALVIENHSSFTPQVLAPCDIVWSGSVQEIWQQSEREALSAWVLSGGGLLLTSDLDQDVVAFNDVLADLGDPFAYSEFSGFAGTTTDIHPHCITRDVTRVHLASNRARLVDVAPHSFLLFADTAAIPNAAGSRYGEGRIVAVAEQLFEDWLIWREDNAVLARAAFDWLAFGAAWLEPSDWSGEAPPGGGSDVTLTADASGLGHGVHSASVVLLDSANEVANIVVPFELLVVGGSQLELSATSLRFPDTYHAATSSETLVISNSGTAPLVVHSMSTDHTCFRADTTSLAVPVGGEAAVLVSFFAEAPGWFEGELSIESNDADMPVIGVPLGALALPSGLADVSPESLSTEVFSGLAETLRLSIDNVGSAELSWSVRAHEPGAGDADPSGVIDWIGFDAVAGTVPEGQSREIRVTVDAGELVVGEHVAELLLETSDPRGSTTIIPVAVDVLDSSPGAGVVETTVEYGVVTLCWWVPTTFGLDGFNVYRSVDGGTTFDRLNEFLVQPATQGGYVDDSCWPGGEFWYEVRAVRSDTTEVTVGTGPVAVRTPGELLTALRPPRPNPFTASTELSFDTPGNGRRVVIRVCDVAGRLVRTLYDG
ncbi:MAG: choice-of-anchor D domain-containing protein, partial [Candidatus Eisenbacteria bacterium]|nr:choice-of-anchor D domain-containing protein [Candidatus Eisenbacteria bacterium]